MELKDKIKDKIKNNLNKTILIGGAIIATITAGIIILKNKKPEEAPKVFENIKNRKRKYYKYNK